MKDAVNKAPQLDIKKQVREERAEDENIQM